MRHLDLFSGIGGFALAARWCGFDTVAFCEIEPYAQKVLAKNFPGVPINNNVKELKGDEYGSVELITAGYPCQPFSVAGQRKGQDDDRHLWPEVKRILETARPRWFLGENVAGHVTMGLDEVLSDLEDIGYTCWPIIIPACAVDAKHRRDRVWIVGYSEHDGSSTAEKRGLVSEASDNDTQGEIEASESERASLPGDGKAMVNSNCLRVEGAWPEQQATRSCGRGEDVANPASVGQSGQGEYVGRVNSKADKEGKADRVIYSGEGGEAVWEPEPAVGRVANGIPARVDRLKGLGNAIVPQVAYEIMRLMK